MPTGPSCAESAAFAPALAGTTPPGPLAAVRLLIAFRLRTTLRSPGRRWSLAVGLLALVALGGLVLVGAAAAPPGSDLALARPGVADILPVAFLGFLLTATTAAIAGGGGREIVPAEQARVFPVGALTDHLAALVLAPVSLAWVLPGLVLAVGEMLVSQNRPVAALVVVVVWTLAATAVAQLVGWVVEGWRGLPHGAVVVRVVVGAVGVALLAVALTGRLAALGRLAGGGLLAGLAAAGDEGRWGVWLLGLVALAVVGVGATVAGGRAATVAARRPPRAQARRETRRYAPRRPTRTTWGLLLRMDRASVWRSAPLRRGVYLLALLPVLVSFEGAGAWETAPILPGMVAAGGALLFGVNSWCLDAAGSWWRESLPVSPRLLLLARGVVVLEIVLGCGVLTLLVSAVRAGPPPGASPVVAAVASTLVACARILASALRWSVRRPHAADLRRPRAAPAPAAAMLGYSVRLAVGASLGGLAFAFLGAAVAWWWVVLAALVLLSTSAFSLWRTGRRWESASQRARVLETVAAI